MPRINYNFKLLIPFGILMLVANISFLQTPIIIDHNNTDVHAVPVEWIESAKANLHIAYGHTSHGSQLISGMTSLEAFFSDGRFDFSSTQLEDHLHLVEGDGYGDGYMELDCGYNGWAEETREYLDAFPECNVIIWSWCGQVNSVDLLNHYFRPMEQLESDYPEVRFVYMTGHLEGLGPDGSVYQANQEIRDYCQDNNKILFDFADIEKYDPDQEVNYQDYFANDECNYDHPDGGNSNWAADWIETNPNEELTLISDHCNYCAHSQTLNCVQKGIAAWHLWAMLAGWDGVLVGSQQSEMLSDILVYPNPIRHCLRLKNLPADCKIIINSLTGQCFGIYYLKEGGYFSLETIHLQNGCYLVECFDSNQKIMQKLVIKL